jgi:hypothetical protein
MDISCFFRFKMRLVTPKLGSAHEGTSAEAVTLVALLPSSEMTYCLKVLLSGFTDSTRSFADRKEKTCCSVKLDRIWILYGNRRPSEVIKR